MTDPKEVLVLDFDGVVLESVAVKDRAFFDLFDDATNEEKKRVLDFHLSTPGINRREKITRLLAEVLGRPPTKDALEVALDRFSGLVWDSLLACKEVPGIRRLLESNKGMPCYVVSASPQDELRALAEARDLTRHFASVYGSPASKAELLRQVVAAEDVSPRALLFIGDKLSDLKAAREVGARFIGRRSPENPTDFPAGTRLISDFHDPAVGIKEIFALEPM